MSFPTFHKSNRSLLSGRGNKLDVDKSRWEKQVREWSAIFKDFPQIEESNVVMEAQLTHRYLVNSEGTRTLQPTMLVSVEVDAGAEAADGMRLRHWIPFMPAASSNWRPSRKSPGNPSNGGRFDGAAECSGALTPITQGRSCFPDKPRQRCLRACWRRICRASDCLCRSSSRRRIVVSLSIG
jgi:hypothetical protein